MKRTGMSLIQFLIGVFFAVVGGGGGIKLYVDLVRPLVSLVAATCCKGVQGVVVLVVDVVVGGIIFAGTALVIWGAIQMVTDYLCPLVGNCALRAAGDNTHE